MTDAPATDDLDAIAFIEAQHREIRALFNQVQGASGEQKDEHFRSLVRLLAVHETAEEEVVHPMVRQIDGGEPVVEGRIEEESQAKQALAELEKMGVEDPGFDEALDQFRRAVDEHAAHEEADELPLLRGQSEDQLARMGDALRIAERTAPTHPHPHGPDSAAGNLVVGPFAAIADRVRDALRR